MLDDLVDNQLGAVHLTCGMPAVIRLEDTLYCEHCELTVWENNVSGRLPERHCPLDQLM